MYKTSNMLNILEAAHILRILEASSILNPTNTSEHLSHLLNTVTAFPRQASSHIYLTFFYLGATYSRLGVASWRVELRRIKVIDTLKRGCK